MLSSLDKECCAFIEVLRWEGRGTDLGDELGLLPGESVCALYLLIPGGYWTW